MLLVTVSLHANLLNLQCCQILCYLTYGWEQLSIPTVRKKGGLIGQHSSNSVPFLV